MIVPRTVSEARRLAIQRGETPEKLAKTISQINTIGRNSKESNESENGDETNDVARPNVVDDDGELVVNSDGTTTFRPRRKSLQEISAQYLAESGLPKYESRPLTSDAEKYVDEFDRLAESHRNWLAFFGKTGTGKSTQAFGIAKALICREKRPVRVKVCNYCELVRELSALRFDVERFFQRIERTLDAELLVLDDFLDVVPKPESFEEQVALTLIKRRYETRRPLILTTELTPCQLLTLWRSHGEAILGRIIEMCEGRISIAPDAAENFRMNNIARPRENFDEIPY